MSDPGKWRFLMLIAFWAAGSGALGAIHQQGQARAVSEMVVLIAVGVLAVCGWDIYRRRP